MALYFGSKKIKLHLNGHQSKLNINLEHPITENVLLFSSENYILQDSNGAYITAIQQEEQQNGNGV